MTFTMLSPNRIKQALELPDFNWLTAQKIMAPSPRPLTRPTDKPGHAQIGAVMVIMFTDETRPMVLLTKRQGHLRSHPGQISFPGGKNETGETLRQTALRETREEIGISPVELTILGRLATVYIEISDCIVHPFVAWHADVPVCRPAPSEVADSFAADINALNDPTASGQEIKTSSGHPVVTNYFSVNGHKVWGATAMILSELLERLKRMSQK
ncbi:MAG: CoA pyrophosphatase [Deltaproteobacteria bacterium]|nr:CoA pyrophosphatase [Deltaproteobacteria bacterium]